MKASISDEILAFLDSAVISVNRYFVTDLWRE